MNRLLIVFFLISIILPIACFENTKNPQNEEASLIDAKIKLYKKKIDQDPSNYINYNNLAQLYLQKARETGDSILYKKAEDTINKSLNKTSDNYIATVLASKIAISNHEFSKALEYAERAASLKPDNSITYAVLGDAYLELGEIKKAETAYLKMHELNSNLDSYSRISRVNFLLGNTVEAVGMMEKAYTSGQKSSMPKENIAWTQVMLGLYSFNQGDFEKAEKHYLRSMAILNDYYLGLEHLAELNARKGDLKEAEKQYLKVIKSNPAPEFYAALSDVYNEIGETQKSKEYNNIAQQKLEAYVENGDVGYLRPLSQFYADNDIMLDKALSLAKRDMKLRSDIYTYDTLAWMHYKNNNLDSAKTLINKALKFGTKDAELYFHAGMIDFKLGNYESASNYMKKVLEINPKFDGSIDVDIKQIITKKESDTY